MRSEGVKYEREKSSSNIHIRKKRVIDYTKEGAKIFKITQFPYIVQVLQKGIKICSGTILSPDYILTAKVCADEAKEEYSVESGGLYMSKIINHPVVGVYIEGHLALLVIRPLIDFELPSLNRNILLFEGVLPPSTLATIVGWGPIRKSEAHTSARDVKAYSFRRAINVPIIDIHHCNEEYSKKYPHNFVLTFDNICTLDTSGKRGCTHEDAGSALIVDDKLLGVLIFSGRIVSPYIPDVFIRVNDNEYNRWILSHVSPYSDFQRTK
ncbi:trypsin-4-like [Belonocnema kinseyi]|uniref:trypsin-4-like n=1 Tax=Belonocnema kinseyi TaxID=2817044 RepID=UPI00143CCB95|nr:trypsin-4-like [Belonocnema kinseyi]